MRVYVCVCVKGEASGLACVVRSIVHFGVCTYVSRFCLLFSVLASKPLFVCVRVCAAQLVFETPPFSSHRLLQINNRLRKRSKQQSRRLTSVLSVPKDDKGELIHLHTAAYNGETASLSSYISQGGDLEVRIKWFCFRRRRH